MVKCVKNYRTFDSDNIYRVINQDETYVWLEDKCIIPIPYSDMSECFEQIDVLKWEPIHGIVTPGGDPAYICPVCHDRDSEHINGIECRTHWNYCPCCGVRLEY